MRRTHRGSGPARGGGCDHRGARAAVVTKLGHHARCPDCGALGPGRSSREAARQALLVLGARGKRRSEGVWGK